MFAGSGKLKGSYSQVIGEGKVLKSKRDLDKPDLPNIATLTRLHPEQICIHHISHFDDLNTCYIDALQIIEQARSDFPEAHIIVDYTGGTKSMTAGLTAAALDDGKCDISLVAGRRDDLVVVQDQTEFVRPVRVWTAGNAAATSRTGPSGSLRLRRRKRSVARPQHRTRAKVLSKYFSVVWISAVLSTPGTSSTMQPPAS